METLHLLKVESASVDAVQILQCPQNIPTNYIRWFICKLPSLYSVSCSKDIRKLNSRGHIFELPLTRAPFQCLQHFRINNLAFPFTCSQATLTWLLRYLIMPANRGLRCPTNSQGGRTVPTRQLCQPSAGAERPGERGRPGCLSQLHRPLPTLQPNAWAASCGWKEFPKSQPELALGASAARPTPRLLLSPFEKPPFPSM